MEKDTDTDKPIWHTSAENLLSESSVELVLFFELFDVCLLFVEMLLCQLYVITGE